MKDKKIIESDTIFCKSHAEPILRKDCKFKSWECRDCSIYLKNLKIQAQDFTQNGIKSFLTDHFRDTADKWEIKKSHCFNNGSVNLTLKLTNIAVDLTEAEIALLSNLDTFLNGTKRFRAGTVIYLTNKKDRKNLTIVTAIKCKKDEKK